MAGIQSVQTNSVPVGGPTAGQSVQPIGGLTPADIAALTNELMPVTMRFRQSSSPLMVNLNQAQYAAQGAQVPLQIATVGLGLNLVSHHHIAVTFTNASTAAQIVYLGSWFPFTLIANTSIQINGGATVYSCSGDGGLVVTMRRSRNTFQRDTSGGFGPALSPAICNITVGANGTATNAAAGRIPCQLSGITQVSVAGSSTCVITADFVTKEWVVLDRQSGLGALPLQNNSTYANLTRTLAASFYGAGDNFPFWNNGAAVNANLSVTTVSGYTNTEYHFFSVPGDPSLYAPLVANSYQVLEQPSVAVASSGVAGLTYNMPQNQFLVALHRILRDGTANTFWPVAFSELLGGQTAGFTNYAAAAYSVSRRSIVYNGGSIIPVVQYPQRSREQFFKTYGADILQLPGYLVWDGQDTANSLNDVDDMGWIDCYHVAQPQSIEDLGASIATGGSAKFIRESVVAGSVQVVGG